MIDPIPGSRRDELLHHLKVILLEARNMPGQQDFLWGTYMNWAVNAERRLRLHLREADIDKLIRTARHHTISVAPPAERVLIDAEVESRIIALDTAIIDLSAAGNRWDQAGRLVVPDTGFFINHPSKIEDTDFSRLLECRETPVRLVVPMVVVDELDNLKRSGQQKARWRAGYSIAVLDRIAGAGHRGQLAAADYSGVDTGEIPRGEVTIEILPDPPRHVRLPINDDEIVDRALSIQTIAGRTVTLLTYDTGHATRARLADIEVLKLSVPMPPEPPNGR